MNMFQKLFGFKFNSKSPKTIRPDDFIDKLDDGSSVVIHAAGDSVLHSANFSSVFENEKQLIEAYRRLAENNYVDSALDDIVNEAIDYDEFTDSTVSINLEKTEFSEPIRKKIVEEFSEVLRLLSYSKNSEELFREWYVDGRHYFYITVGPDPTQGIKQIRKLDSRYVKRVKKIIFNSEKSFEENLRMPETKLSYIFMIPDQSEHELSWMGSYKQMIGSEAVEITEEAIAYADSDVYSLNGRVISRLDRTIKWANKLGMMEDSLVIYRLARAPERRAFYVDVGDMQPNLVDEYMTKLINKFKNKANYNSETGLMTEQYEVRNMLEDIWLPRKEGKSTEVQNLAGGQNLGELQDVEYFRQGLYKSLKIPLSRLVQESQYNLGRAAEITRDEVKFSKYVKSLLGKFSNIFSEILKRQLVLKKIITPTEWSENRDRIQYDFARNSYFEELKRIDMLNERLTLIGSLEGYVGKYIDKDFVWQQGWGFAPEFIDKMKSGIEKDKQEEEALAAGPGVPGEEGAPKEDLPDGESEDLGQDFSPTEDFSPDGSGPTESDDLPELGDDEDLDTKDFSPKKNFKPE